MGLLDEFRVDIGDDEGAITSGIAPAATSGLPVGSNITLLSDLRVDIGDDEGTIPSGAFADGIAVHDLLSPQHSDTTPASPSAGDLILGGSTWSVLSSGNEGEVLSISEGVVSWEALPSGVDVSGAISVHASDPSAHHARYTDAEASGVAVQVVTTGILEHTAISGAHHPRYTNAEAAIVAAAVLATGVVSADNVAILQESGVELTSDATTTAVLPTLSTLLSSDISLINPSGNIRVVATASVNASGPVPVLFHLYIDGVFYRGTTINVTGAIDNAAIVIPRVAVTGVNPHTVDLRWTKFSSPGVTVRCLPSSLPNFYHASLSVQEVV